MMDGFDDTDFPDVAWDGMSDEFAGDFLDTPDEANLDGSGRNSPPRRHPIIGLVGRARTGKDTIARALVDQHRWTKIAFADPIRHTLMNMNPYVGGGMRLLDVLDLYGGWSGVKQTEYGLEIRQLMQHLGTEGIRELDQRFWAQLMEKRIRAIPGPVVITDVRFENEAQLVTRLGGTLVRVNRPGIPNLRFAHSSEAIEQIDCALVIDNTGTVEDLAGPVIHELLFAVHRDQDLRP